MAAASKAQPKLLQKQLDDIKHILVGNSITAARTRTKRPEWKWQLKISPQLKAFYESHGLAELNDDKADCPASALDEKGFVWYDVPDHLSRTLTRVYQGKLDENKVHLQWFQDGAQGQWKNGIVFDIAPWNPPGSWFKRYQETQGQPPACELEINMHLWRTEPIVATVVRVVPPSAAVCTAAPGGPAVESASMDLS